EDKALARTRQAEHPIDLGPGEDARFPNRLAGGWQTASATIRGISLGHAPAIEGTQDPVIGVEGRRSERGPLGADLAVEAMSGPASVALKLLAQLAHVLALDLVDGADALAGQGRQDASRKGGA